jgi:hypothetical protein
MRDRIGLVLIAMWLFSAAAGAATTKPATPGPAAEPWLTRAQREIADLPADAPNDLRPLQSYALAVTLYRLAPTTDRQALAAQLIDRAVKAEAEKKRSDEEVRLAYTVAALSHAAIDDADGARRLLAAADRPTGATPTSQPYVRLITADYLSMALTETCLRLGDNAGFERAALNAFQANLVAGDLRADRLNDQAARATEWALKKYVAATTQRSDSGNPSGTDPETNRREAARCQVEAGDLAGAARAAALVEVDLPVEALPHAASGYDLCQAQIVVARGCLGAGDLNGYRSARDAIIAAVRKDPDAQSDSFYHNVVNLCVRAQDPAGVAAVAAVWKAQFEPDASKDTAHRLLYVGIQ